jgi:hypothetical protein
MENLVKGNFEPTQQYSEFYSYLDALNHPQILAEEKEAISEFVSNIVMEEISVKSIETLRNNSKKSSSIEPVTIMTEESKFDDNEELKDHEFPKIDTKNNILGIKWSNRVSKLLWRHLESTYQNKGKGEQNTVWMVHYWVAQNKMSYDSYYIVKNLIYSILYRCPEILSFFKLHDLDINIDLFLNSSETLKLNHTEIFITFLSKLRELKLDYNIVIWISQASLTYNRNHLWNFIFLLRQAIKFAPPYLKFVLTFTCPWLMKMDEIFRALLINNGGL